MIKKFILCDQAPWLWSDPNESDESMILHGGHRGHPYELKKGYDISWEEGQKVFDSKNFFPNGPSSLADSFPNACYGIRGNYE